MYSLTVETDTVNLTEGISTMFEESMAAHVTEPICKSETHFALFRTVSKRVDVDGQW